MFMYDGEFTPKRYAKDKHFYRVYKVETRCYNCGGVQEVSQTEVGRTHAAGAAQAVRNVCHRLKTKVADVVVGGEFVTWVRYCAEVVVPDGDIGGHTPTGGETCEH